MLKVSRSRRVSYTTSSSVCVRGHFQRSGMAPQLFVQWVGEGSTAVTDPEVIRARFGRAGVIPGENRQAETARRQGQGGLPVGGDGAQQRTGSLGSERHHAAAGQTS